MDERILAASVRQLINEVLARYGSVEAFCDYLHSLLEAPTDRLPIAVTEIPASAGRHRRRESVA